MVSLTASFICSQGKCLILWFFCCIRLTKKLEDGQKQKENEEEVNTFMQYCLLQLSCWINSDFYSPLQQPTLLLLSNKTKQLQTTASEKICLLDWSCSSEHSFWSFSEEQIGKDCCQWVFICWFIQMLCHEPFPDDWYCHFLPISCKFGDWFWSSNRGVLLTIKSPRSTAEIWNLCCTTWRSQRIFFSIPSCL